jgi:hypothetical protein
MDLIPSKGGPAVPDREAGVGVTSRFDIGEGREEAGVGLGRGRATKEEQGEDGDISHFEE